MGIMAQKFAEKGISPRDIEFDIAIAKFENNGGTFDEAIARVRAAYRMGSEGQTSAADEAGGDVPSPPHTHAAKGHPKVANTASRAVPDAARYGTEGGQGMVAEKASRIVPPSVPTTSIDHPTHNYHLGHGTGQPATVSHAQPLRRLSPVIVHRALTSADLRAMATVEKKVAVTIMDTLRIDGRAIGDWTIGEALSVGRDKLRNGHILVAVATHYANADPMAKVRSVMKVSDLQRIIQKAAESADAD